MAQDINYNKRIEVANTSSGGALQFFSVGKVTNGNLAKTANTKDEQTWDDDGFEKPVRTTRTGVISLELISDPTNQGQAIIEKAWFNNETIQVNFYTNKITGLQKYYGEAIVTSVTDDSGADGGSTTISVTLNIVGPLKKTQL